MEFLRRTEFPYQKGTGLVLDGYEVSVTEVLHEYRSQYLQDNSYSPTGKDVEMEQPTPPPPPTEPELDDPIVFDPSRQSQAYGTIC